MCGGGAWWSWCAGPIIEELPDELPAPPRFPELMDAPPVPMVIEVESEATSDFEEEQERFFTMLSTNLDLAIHEAEATEAHASAAWCEIDDAPELLDGITTATPPCPPQPKSKFVAKKKPKPRLQSPKRPPARPKAEEKKAKNAPKPPATPPPGHDDTPKLR